MPSRRSLYDDFDPTQTVGEVRQTLRELLAENFKDAGVAIGEAIEVADQSRGVRTQLDLAKSDRKHEKARIEDMGVPNRTQLQILADMLYKVEDLKEQYGVSAKAARDARNEAALKTLQAAALVPVIVTGRAAEVIGGAMVGCATAIGTAVQFCADRIIGYDSSSKLTRPAYIKQEVGKFFGQVRNAVDKAVKSVKELPSQAVGLLAKALSGLASKLDSLAKKLETKTQDVGTSVVSSTTKRSPASIELSPVLEAIISGDKDNIVRALRGVSSAQPARSGSHAPSPTGKRGPATPTAGRSQR